MKSLCLNKDCDSIEDPDDPAVIWKKLADQFQKKMRANKLGLKMRLCSLKLKGDSIQ